MIQLGLFLKPMKVEPAAKPKSKSKPKPKPNPNPKPVAPAPKRQYEKRKDNEFKQPACHGIRHSYQPYIRTISTPDWAPAEAAAQSSENFSGFDFCEVHERLELFEHRIINGGDPQYRHPAQCLKAAEERELQPTTDESERRERYSASEVIERIPRFWPERKWDHVDDKMSEEETKRLQDAMGGPPVDGRMVKLPARVRPSSKGSHRVKKTSVVLLDSHDYRTDGSDGETDWDEL
jgi:hypothetical protein